MAEFRLYRVVPVNRLYWNPDKKKEEWLGNACVEVGRAESAPGVSKEQAEKEFLHLTRDME